MTDADPNAPERHRLGEILLKRNLLTQEQLEEALEAQKTKREYLGEILIRLGFVDEQDILVALVVQCNLPYIATKAEIEKAIDKWYKV